MSCEIIQFSAAARTGRPETDNRAGVTSIGDRVVTPRERREGKREFPPPATETGKKLPDSDRAPRRPVACRWGCGLLADAH